MKKLLNIALAIGFCLMFCFLAVGYAALNDELHVTGTVSYKHVKDEEVGGSIGESDNTLAAGLYIGHGSSDNEASDNAVKFPLYRTSDNDGDGQPDYYSIIDSSKLPNLANYNSEDSDYTRQVIGCAIPGFVSDRGKQFFIVSKDTDTWKTETTFSSYGHFDYSLKENVTYRLDIYGVNVKDEKGNIRDEGRWTFKEISSNTETEQSMYALDTTAITNLTIESQEAQTMDLFSAPNLLLTLTPAEGYLLPETFTVTISGTEYAISTAGENETETMLWEAETNTLYMLGDILPTDGSPVVVTAHAVPELPGFTLNTDGLLHLTAQWHTANGCLNLSLTVEEGYLLPETMTVTINDAPYTVYTIPEGENPAGMGYDPIENVLTIHFSLIPQDALITLVAEAIPEPEEEETEPTEEPTDPTEEITESTEEPTDPTEETTEPTGEPTDPTEETTEPTGEPTDPTEETTEPTGEPTDPTEEITEPTDPTEETTEPTGEPMNPAEKTTEPTGEPMDPTEKTTEPTEESTDPTEETSTLTEECTVSADDGADSEHP